MSEHRILKEIGQYARQTTERLGFTPPKISDWESSNTAVPAYLALIHSEVSEALEDFRVNSSTHFAEELADIIIRTCDLAFGLGIDLDVAVQNKQKINESRPVKHGGKRI